MYNIFIGYIVLAIFSKDQDLFTQNLQKNMLMQGNAEMITQSLLFPGILVKYVG